MKREICRFPNEKILVAFFGESPITKVDCIFRFFSTNFRIRDILITPESMWKYTVQIGSNLP